MPTDIEKLVVQLDADVRSYQKNLLKSQGYTRQWQRQIDSSTAAAERRFKQMSDSAKTSTSAIDASFSNLGKTLAAGFAAVGAIKGFQDLADAATRVQNSLKVAGLSGAELTKVYNALFASAQKNATPIESIIQLYSRLALVQKDLGASSADLISFSDDIGKALRVGGVSAEQASGALLQLSQALGSGTVHAEEFNSILEGATPILQAAAAGIKETGGSVSKLKQLVIDGKISSQQLFRGILEGSKILDERLKGSVLTVDQAITRFRNSLVDAAGKINDVTGASQAAVTYISQLGDYIEALSHVFEAAASGSIGDYIEKLKILYNITKNIPTINPFGSIPSAEDLNKFADAITTTGLDKLQQAREELASKLGESVPRGRNGATEEEAKQVDALVSGLKDGTITAQEFEKAIAALGSRFANLAKQLQPFVDKLKEAQGIVNATADAIPVITNRPPSEGAQEAQRKADASAFLAEKVALETRTQKEKELADLTAKFLKDAKEAAKNITEAEATAAARLALEKEAQNKVSTEAANSAAELIKGFESFRSTPYKDVNHLRVGYGSDTVTLDDGSVREVVAGMTVSVADANRDLMRRIADFQAGIQNKIGADTFNSLNSSQQAALTSIAYNYGTLPDRIVQAIKTGDQGTVYQAIKALGPDNGGINQGRRDQEASLYLSGAPDAVTKRVSSQEDFAKSLQAQQQQLVALKEEAGLRASLNPLLNDYGQKLSELQKAQELFNIAQQEGTAAGKELTSSQQLLNGDISKLSPEAQKQALAMRALATEYGNTTASSNRLEESQAKLKQTVSDFASGAKDVVGGALTDIRSALEDGKITAQEWGDILVGVLNKIADKVQDLLLDQLFKPSNFGFLTSILGGGLPSGGVGGFGVAASGVRAPAGLAQGQLQAPAALNRVVNSKMSNISQLNNGPSHIVLTVDDDGAIQAYVAKQGRMTEISVLKRSNGALENYRRGQFRQDVEKHLSSRRVRGTI